MGTIRWLLVMFFCFLIWERSRFEVLAERRGVLSRFTAASGAHLERLNGPDVVQSNEGSLSNHYLDESWGPRLNRREAKIDHPDDHKSKDSLLAVPSEDFEDEDSASARPEGVLDNDNTPAGQGTTTQDTVCGMALLQGRRLSQEDRVVCTSQLFLPVSGAEGASKQIGVYAVFDGHAGHEASTFAANALHQHILSQFSAIVEAIQSGSSNSHSILSKGEDLQSQADDKEEGPVRGKVSSLEVGGTLVSSRTNLEVIARQTSSEINGGDTIMEKKPECRKEGYPGDPCAVDNFTLRSFLEEALRRAILSLDSVFSMEASRHGLDDGTTACVVLQADEYLLIANLGDSKAFFCEVGGRVKSNGGRRKRHTGSVETYTDGFLVRELTSDHRPDRDDERARVEAAGGFITKLGDVARVNGQLAVSRSIGDIQLKKYGITAEPELSGWMKIPSNQSFLVIATDGVFERMSTQDVCRVLYAVHSNEDAALVLDLESSSTGAPIALPTSRGAMDNGDKMSWIDGENSGSSEERHERFPLASTELLKNGLGAELDFMSTKRMTFVEELGMVQSMAQAVVDAAVEMGSMDNVAAIVVALDAFSPMVQLPISYPLEITDELPTQEPKAGLQVNEVTVESMFKRPTLLARESLAMTNVSNAQSWKMEHPDNISSLLMTNTSCYELLETMPRGIVLPLQNIMKGKTVYEDKLLSVVDTLSADDHAGKSIVDRSFWHSTWNQGLGQKALLGWSAIGSGWSLDVYREHLVCPPQQSVDEKHMEVCLMPEGLSHFLELIGSVPLDSQTLLPGGDLTADSDDPPVFALYSTHHHRYMLTKNFARGAFGEVWLAVRRALSGDEGMQESQFQGVSYSKCCTVDQELCPHLGSENNGSNGSSDTQSAGDQGSLKYDETTYILKRILVERGDRVYLSGLREKYFGELFINATRYREKSSERFKAFTFSPANLYQVSISESCPWVLNNSVNDIGETMGSHTNRIWSTGGVFGTDGPQFGSSSRDVEKGVEHIARYVESFAVVSKPGMWLVFKNEGVSLSSLLYTSDVADLKEGMEGVDGVFTVVKPSPWWHWLKTTADGQNEMRNLLQQLLLAVSACHIRNITHRDIKPENMIVRERDTKGSASHTKSEFPSNLTMRLIDFGSAINEFTLKHLYGPSGPSRTEETLEYSPPEVLLGKHWLHFHAQKAHMYDLWSVGVVMLELVLGTPHVFQISSRTRALLESRLQGWDEAAKETVYMLRVFLEMCILLPGGHPQHQFIHKEEGRLASWECTEEAFMQQIKRRDPLGIGMPDKWAARLVRHLLQWYPDDRISAEDALRHPYFNFNLQVD